MLRLCHLLSRNNDFWHKKWEYNCYDDDDGGFTTSRTEEDRNDKIEFGSCSDMVSICTARSSIHVSYKPIYVIMITETFLIHPIQQIE